MIFDVTYDGRTTLAVDSAGALAMGYPQAAIGAGLKAAAQQQIAGFADRYRAALASASAGKLAEYRIKEQIAADPGTADPDELVMIDREAAARGVDRAGLLAIFAAKAKSYRHIALLIGALEAEAKAAIAAVNDGAVDVEPQLHSLLEAAQSEAELGFAAAQAMLAD